MIRERISTDNLRISTDVAPDTSKFSLQFRGSRSVSSTAEQQRNAAGTSLLSSGLTEVLELDYPEDAEAGGPLAEHSAAAAGEGAGTLQPGDLIYEFVPSMAREILSWSGISNASLSSFGSVGTLGTLPSTLHLTMRSTTEEAGLCRSADGASR